MTDDPLIASTGTLFANLDAADSTMAAAAASTAGSAIPLTVMGATTTFRGTC